MDAEHFNFVESTYRSEFPLHHYGFVLSRTFATALAAIVTNILLYYFLIFIRHLFKKYTMLEEVVYYWMDWVIFFVNVCITATVALVLESKMRRYWSRKVLLKFAAERNDLFPKEEL